MDIFLAEMPSYTYAVKAQRLLRSHGISSSIRRRRTSCGFDLIFRSPAALSVLDRSAIPYDLRSSGGVP